MTTWLNAVLEVPHQSWAPAREFWAAATGWQESSGSGEHGRSALLPPAGDSWLWLQRVPGEQAGLHVELGSSDLGGIEEVRSPGGFVLRRCAGGPGRTVRTGSSILDQVCLDIPPADWDTETAFWAEVTGRSLEQGSMPGFARLVDAGGGLRLLLQRRDEGERPVTAHPDLAVADRPGETARHRGLGAEVVDVREWWTVLRAPDGRLYCLTDRDPATGRVGSRPATSG